MAQNCLSCFPTESGSPVDLVQSLTVQPVKFAAVGIVVVAVVGTGWVHFSSWDSFFELVWVSVSLPVPVYLDAAVVYALQ